tara:strand:+ start:4456 stop:5145 length:690 start_codon:yes stop_codon:yes gene_type:complete
MLKHHQTLCVLLAGGLTVPAVIGQDDDLFVGLNRTVIAIEELAGVREDIEARKPGAVQQLLNATDAPLAATQERDLHIDDLRQDVARLQGELDNLDRVAMNRIANDPHATGMSNESRTMVALGGPAPVQATPQESEGYSIDALRQARLMITARRFTDAESLLQTIETTSESRYWMARAFSGLGRDAEALAELELVAADDDAGDFQRWANQDKRMIEVRIELSRSNGRNN